jgi:hypothetical protein
MSADGKVIDDKNFILCCFQQPPGHISSYKAAAA